MAFKYAKTGAPFNFLGHFSETQKTAFENWINGRVSNFQSIQAHYQMRAQQLRKTAGLLEQYYSKEHEETLSPSFTKETWQPGSDGHFHYAFRDDHQPMVVMSQIKALVKEQLSRQDEGVFHMNQVRTLIERHEDAAQFSNEAPTKLSDLLSRIEYLFGQPEYQAVLVKDQSDQYKGEPRFRVHQLDEPTAWEKDINNRVDLTQDTGSTTTDVLLTGI